MVVCVAVSGGTRGGGSGDGRWEHGVLANGGDAGSLGTWTLRPLTADGHNYGR